MRTNRRVLYPAGLLWRTLFCATLAGVALAAAARDAGALPVRLQVDPVRSYVALLSGATVTVDLDPVGAGETVPLGAGVGAGFTLPDGTTGNGLRAPLAGELFLDLTPTTVLIQQRSVVRALPSGSFRPGAGGPVPGAESAAALAAHFDTTLVSGDIALRDLVFELSGFSPYTAAGPESFTISNLPPPVAAGEVTIALSSGLGLERSFGSFLPTGGRPTATGRMGRGPNGALELILDYGFAAGPYNAADLSLPFPLSITYGVEARIVAQAVPIPEPGPLASICFVGLVVLGRRHVQRAAHRRGARGVR